MHIPIKKINPLTINCGIVIALRAERYRSGFAVIYSTGRLKYGNYCCTGPQTPDSAPEAAAPDKIKLPKVVGGFDEKIKIDVVKLRICLIISGSDY